MLQNKIASGEFALLAEFDPPKGIDTSSMLHSASRIKGQVDAIVVSEMNNSVMRLSSLGGSLLLQQKGFEVVMQVCCRDRNRLALQGDLLAAGSLGITNLMLVQGDPPDYGDHPETRAVDDLDLAGLQDVVVKMRNGRDLAGAELLGSPSFFVGQPLDIGTDPHNMDWIKQDMEKRLNQGAQYFVTRPVFDPALLDALQEAIGPLTPYVVPSVLLLKSLGMARYIDMNIDSLFMPPDLITRIKKSPDKANEGIKIAAETVHAIRERGFGGAMLSTMGWERRLPEIVNRIK
ncbi:MAG: methylenetetrahydrofolate reductase [Desulfohalobiaceae bacterium]|nr:methylenetetrahydrofolate reductase [Desulfohalobiaceae bacterium]